MWKELGRPSGGKQIQLDGDRSASHQASVPQKDRDGHGCDTMLDFHGFLFLSNCICMEQDENLSRAWDLSVRSFQCSPQVCVGFLWVLGPNNESDKRGILRSESESTGPGPVEDQGKEDSPV